MALISALTRYEVPPSPMGRYTLNHTMAKNRIRSERKKEKKRFLPKSRKIEKSVFCLFFLGGQKKWGNGVLWRIPSQIPMRWLVTICTKRKR